MAARTKPVRILVEDHAPLRFLAQLKGRSPAEAFHEVLADYVENHKDELRTVYTGTQRALAAGDIDALTQILASSEEEEVAALMADRLSIERATTERAVIAARQEAGRRAERSSARSERSTRKTAAA